MNVNKSQHFNYEDKNPKGPYMPKYDNRKQSKQCTCQLTTRGICRQAVTSLMEEVRDPGRYVPGFA